MTTRTITLPPTDGGARRRIEVQTAADSAVIVIIVGRARMSVQCSERELGELLDAVRHAHWLVKQGLLRLWEPIQ